MDTNTSPKEPTACMDCGEGDANATNHTICDRCLERRYPEKE